MESVGKKELPSFKAPLLQTGQYLLSLLSTLDKRLVNQAHVTPGLTDEEKEHNSMYLLNLLWSTGVPVNALPSEIAKVQSAAIKTVVKCMYNYYHKN